MKKTFLLLVFLASIALSNAADLPKVYNHVPGELTELDKFVHTALAPKYTVIDLPDSEDFIQPKPTAGSLPRVAHTTSGESLGGAVMVAYIVTAEGLVTSPIVLKTDNERLNTFATKAMESWRFEPARIKGEAVATTAVQDFNFEAAPTEFVTQVLEPTGGKITRPKDWFYAENHHGPVYMWTLSREDTSGNKRYTTGVRIQCFSNIKEGTGKTSKEFILNFVAEKKKEGAKIIKTGDEENQGLFTRVCLETEEGPFHILYSLFWGNNMDLAVVSIAGTDKELWDIYSPVFDKMGTFELIDMKRFEK